jgi:hypothetical protein
LTVQKTVSTLVGLALFIALAVAAWFGLQWLLGVVQAGGPLADLTNALLLAALGGVAYLYRASREKRQQLETRLGESKRALYEGYVDVLKDVARRTKAGSTEAAPEHIEQLRTFAFRSVLIASDEVLKAHIRFTNLGRISTSEKAALPAVADVLLALRKDMGFPDTKLTGQDLLGVFVNEIDAIAEHFRVWETDKRDWDEKMGWTASERRRIGS